MDQHPDLGETNRAHEVGNLAIQVVAECWPQFIENDSGNWLDLHGVDGWLNHVPVQVKADARLSGSGNLYHEKYKRTYEHRNDPLGDPWRISPCWAVNLIVVTHYMAYVISIDAIVRAGIGTRLTQINDTSVGYLIPLDTLEIKTQMPHTHRMEAKKPTLKAPPL